MLCDFETLTSKSITKDSTKEEKEKYWRSLGLLEKEDSPKTIEKFIENMDYYLDFLNELDENKKDDIYKKDFETTMIALSKRMALKGENVAFSFEYLYEVFKNATFNDVIETLFHPFTKHRNEKIIDVISKEKYSRYDTSLSLLRLFEILNLWFDDDYFQPMSDKFITLASDLSEEDVYRFMSLQAYVNDFNEEEKRKLVKDYLQLILSIKENKEAFSKAREEIGEPSLFHMLKIYSKEKKENAVEKFIEELNKISK